MHNLNSQPWAWLCEMRAIESGKTGLFRFAHTRKTANMAVSLTNFGADGQPLDTTENT